MYLNLGKRRNKECLRKGSIYVKIYTTNIERFLLVNVFKG